MEDDSIAITMKNRPVPILNVVAETPDPPQGDTTAKPIPAPNDNSTSVIASEAAAPADTAAQETPDIEGSTASRSADCRRVHSSRAASAPNKCANACEVPERERSNVRWLTEARAAVFRV
jgi:hypothetical protein